MWGQRKPTTGGIPGSQSPATSSLRALNAVEDLRRSAGWARLGEAERGSLRTAFPAFPAQARDAATAAASPATDVALQRWVADLVTPAFQVEAAQVIRGWLEDASPSAHLYVGGSYGQGRTSLVASLARQVMAQRPTPNDFCYVPEPSALDRAYLLPLPGGTGQDFAAALDQALRQVTGAWSDDSDDSDDSAPASGAGKSSRPQLVAQAFSALAAPAFEPVRAYISALRATFDTLATADVELPVTYDDLATWLVRGASGDGASVTQGAPVIVGSLVRDKLEDLLLRANGGVLILPAADVVGVAGAWPVLSVALASRTLPLKDTWPPLPLTTRVALVGGGDAYNALASSAGGFTRVFRYETWLNYSVSWTPQAEATYAMLADGVALYHGLPVFDPSGVAKLVEEGARRSDGLNRSYLITDLVILHDIAVEAGRLASSRGASATAGDDVVTAMRRRRKLQGASAQRVREAILSGQANTPTAGAAIGQINGLGIYEFHPPEGNFAVPTRISATVSPGRDERLLDIEHEAEQADADHVRGEMTIGGYLAFRYGQERPIALAARIRFEQEHGTTGGDSASGAILFALLSALAQIPISFSRAVTGAVGQYGELQPIGGVNTKIEGFWNLCRARRAQGEQAGDAYGVVIPAINARDLMLPDEVAEAIASEGWFHIWPVTTVDEALTILTGVPASEIHARVERRLQQFHQLSAPGNSR